MNDNDIIKALEVCCDADEAVTCSYCPYKEYKGGMVCIDQMCKNALDLINRLEKTNRKNDRIIELADKTIETQKAEIERLQNTLDDVLDREPVLVERSEKYAKSEAIKEFAERLKKEATVDDDSIWWVAGVDIDNLVKEMVGDAE